MAKAYRARGRPWDIFCEREVDRHRPLTIANSLKDVSMDLAQQEEQEWEQWFAGHDVRPFRLAYEDLAAQHAEQVRAVAFWHFFGEGDERHGN